MPTNQEQVASWVTTATQVASQKVTASAAPLKSTVVVISPREAATLLQKSRNLRGLKRTLVERYAASMRAGKWTLNGETVKLDADGYVIDGQHRLQACIEADVSFATLLVTGATADDVDEGYMRTFHDMLGGLGITAKCIAGAMVRAIYLLGQGKDPWAETERRGNTTLMEFYETMDPKRFEWARSLGANNQRPIPGTTVATIAYQVGVTPEARELAEEFFTGLSKMVGLKEGSAQLLLLKWAENNRGEKRQGSHWRRAMYVATCRAWNAFVSGKPVTGNRLWSRIHEAPLPTLLTQ